MIKQFKVTMIAAFLFIFGGMAVSNMAYSAHDQLAADTAFLVRTDGCWINQVVYAISEHLTDAQNADVNKRLGEMSDKMNEAQKFMNILHFEKELKYFLGEYSADITVQPAELEALRDFCKSYPNFSD